MKPSSRSSAARIAKSARSPGAKNAAPSATVDRYARGWAKLQEVDGGEGTDVIAALGKICPDLARYTIEYPFGDLYSRPGLGLREREIAAVSALIALGHARPQLKVHLHAALNVGCTRAELLAIVLQMTAYVGFPAALNAASAAAEVFAEHPQLGGGRNWSGKRRAD